MKLRYGSPEEAGFRPETASLIKKRAGTWTEGSRTPALVLLVARRGVIFLHESYGRTGPEEDAPTLPKDALFPLASLTKPITATAIMILVEEGKIGPNRPVQEYIPEFEGEGKAAVMVHHLLTHTSGFNDDDMFTLLEQESTASGVTAEPDALPSVDELLQVIFKVPLRRPPGVLMNYSDSGYYLAGEIVQRVSGLPLAKFASERIFKPLEMKDSTYILQGKLQDRVVRRATDAPGAHFHTKAWMERPSPSAGVYSTALDMARFGQMFLNGGCYGSEQILSPAAVAAMTQDQIPGLKAQFGEEAFPHACWSFGWSVFGPFKGSIYGEILPSPEYFGHGGSGGVEMWVDPTREIVGIYFSTALGQDVQGFASQDADLLMNMVSAGVLDGEDQKHKISVKPQIRKLSAEADLPNPKVLRPGSFEEAGVDPQRVERLKRLAHKWVESGMHPSLRVLAARHGVLFLDETLGRMGSENDAPPLKPDAIFPLASISKPITATAAMILVEEGLMGLNRPVQEYIPEFQGNGREHITIRHLLTHTSGLRGEDLFEFAVGQGIVSSSEPTEENWAQLRDRPFSEYLDLIYALPPADLPDKIMVYASLNYDLLADIIARLSGSTFSAFVQQRVLEPLGMENTFIPLPSSQLSRVVRRPASAPYSPILASIIKRSPLSGSSGFWAAAADLAVFGQMILNGGSYGDARILSPASAAAMTRDQIPGLEAIFEGEALGAAEWGLGWSIHKTKKSWAYDEPLLSKGSYCHSGTGGVFIWVDPQRDLVAVFFSVYLEDTVTGQPVAATDLFINAVLASLV